MDVYSDEVSNQTRYAGDGIVTCSRAMESMLTPEPTVCSVDRAATYWWVCAFKYVWRFPHKGGARDVRKAIDCLERLLERIDGDASDEIQKSPILSCQEKRLVIQ